MEEMIAHSKDTRTNTFFIQLINLKKRGSIAEHIENFQRLNIKVTNIQDDHLIDVFIGTLKDNIQLGKIMKMGNTFVRIRSPKFLAAFFRPKICTSN
jgi:hypothetical protein